MYNPVNVSVSHSPLLIRSLYVIHLVIALGWLGVLYAYSHWSVLLTLSPVWMIQAWHLKPLMHKQNRFQRDRHWQFFNGQVRLQQNGQWQEVEVRAHQVSAICVILRFRESKLAAWHKSSAWQWDILMYDACEAESFRQLVALMRTEYLNKAS